MPTNSNLNVTPTSADRYWSSYLPLTLKSDSKEIYNETDSSYDLVDSIFTRKDYTGRETFTQNPGKNTIGNDYTLSYNPITSGRSFSNPNKTLFNYVDVLPIISTMDIATIDQSTPRSENKSIGFSFWVKINSNDYDFLGGEFILALLDNERLSFTIDGAKNFSNEDVLRVIISDNEDPYPGKTIFTTPFTFDTWEHYYIYVEDLTITGGISAFRNGVDCVDPLSVTTDKFSYPTANDLPSPDFHEFESASLASLNGGLPFSGEISDFYVSTNRTFKNYLNDFYTNNIPTLSETNLLEIIDNGDLTIDKYLLASDEVSSSATNLLDIDYNNSCNPKPIGHVFVGNNGYLDMTSKVPALSGETFFGVSMRVRLPKEGPEGERFYIMSLQNPGLGDANSILEISYYYITSATGFIEVFSQETSGSFNKAYVATIGEEIPNPVTSAGPNILEFNHLFVYIDYTDGNNGDVNIYLNGVKQTGIGPGINNSVLTAFPQNPEGWYLNGKEKGSGVVEADLGCQISDLYWSTDPAFKDRVSEYYDFPVITFDDQVLSEPISVYSDSDVRVRLTDGTLETGVYNITTTQATTTGEVDFEVFTRTINNLTVTPTSAERYWSDNLSYVPLTLSSNSRDVYNETNSSYDLVDSIFTRNDYTGRGTFTQNPGKNTFGNDYVLGYNPITLGKSFSNPNRVTSNYVDVLNQLPTTLDKKSIGFSFWIKTDSSNYEGSTTGPIIYLTGGDVSIGIDQFDIDLVPGGTKENILRVVINNQISPYGGKSIVTTPFTFDTWEHYYIYVEDLTLSNGISAFRNGVDCVHTSGPNSANVTLSTYTNATLTSLFTTTVGSVEISDFYMSTNSTFKDYLNNFYTNNIPTLSDTNLLEIIDNGDLTSDKYLSAGEVVERSTNIFGDVTETTNPNTNNVGIDSGSSIGYANVKSYMPNTAGANSVGISLWIKVDSSLTQNGFVFNSQNGNDVHFNIQWINNIEATSVERIQIKMGSPDFQEKSCYTNIVARDVWQHYFIYVDNLNSVSPVKVFKNGVDDFDVGFNISYGNSTNALPLGLNPFSNASLGDRPNYSSSFIGSVSDAYFSINPNFKDYINDYYTNSIPTLTGTNSLDIITQPFNEYVLVSGASSNLLDLDYNNSCNPKPIGHVFVGNNGYLDMSSKVPALSGETFFGVSMRLRLPKEAENYDDPGYDYPRLPIMSLQNPGLGPDNAILDITYTYNFTSATGFIEASSFETSGVGTKINVATIGEEIPNPVTSAGPDILEFNHLFVYIDYNDGNNGDINIYLNGVKQTGIFGGLNSSVLTAFPQNPEGWYLNGKDLGSGVVLADLGCQISDLYWSTDPLFKGWVNKYYDFPVITFDDQVLSEPISSVSDSEVRVRLTDDTLIPGIYNITTTQTTTSGDVDFEIVATNVVEIKTTGREKGTFFNNQLNVTGRYFTAATFTFNGEEITPLGFNDTSALLEIPNLPPGTYTLSANPT